MAQLSVQRYEKKQLIPLTDAYLLRGRMESALHLDAHAHDGPYLVRSLYFDTPDDRDFFDKLDGLLERQKVRLRVYDPRAESGKLEIKQKYGDYQQKSSLTVSKSECQRLISGDYHWLSERPEPVAMRLFLLFATELYIPRCIVEYDRLAFFVPENDTRVTFDMNLRASMSSFDVFDEKLFCSPVSGADSVILEIKYNGFLLSYVKDMLYACYSLPLSVSKYCLARGMGGLS